MILLSDRIQKFIDWLDLHTDFTLWDEEVKVQVQKKLIEIMTEQDP